MNHRKLFKNKIYEYSWTFVDIHVKRKNSNE